MNLHLIRHVGQMTRNLGPLWVHSAFGVEANYGVVCKSITSKKDILHQLCWKYAMKQTMKSPTQSKISISDKKIIKLENENRELFLQAEFQLGSNGHLTIYKSLCKYGVMFSSVLSKEKQTIDYFIRVGDEIGCIHFFFISDSTIYVLIEKYEITEKIDHFLKIRSEQSKKIIKFENVDEKMLYLKFGINEYVTSIPNKYEKL